MANNLAKLFDIEDMQGRTRQYYEVRDLREADREMARLLLLGFRPKRIASILKCSAVHVRNVANSPAMQRHLQMLQEKRDSEAVDVARGLKNLSVEALEVVEDAIRDENYPLEKKVDAAFRVLAASGHGPTTKIQGQHVHAIADADLIREINNRLDEQEAEERQYGN